MARQTAPVWLVTGASGFLGANLGAWLSGRAHRIGVARTALHRPELFESMHAADLESPAPVADLIRAERPDVVVHAAAIAYHDRCEQDPDLAFAVNVEASRILAEAASDAGSQFVLISTDAVFDGAKGGYREDDPVSPTSVYGTTKVEAEQAVMGALDALIVRTNFFGWSPSGQRSILEFFVNALFAGQHVRGFADVTTSSAYAPVLAEALWDLVGRAATGMFHVTSPDCMTKHAFGVAVAEEFGLEAGLITPTRADIQPPRNGDISLDNTKVQTVLGHALPSMLEGIKRARDESSTLRRSIVLPQPPRLPA